METLDNIAYKLGLSLYYLKKAKEVIKLRVHKPPLFK